jgi:hypothetical protein
LRNSFLVPVTNEALQTILGKYTGLWKILWDQTIFVATLVLLGYRGICW